jgi:hypothetical protein
MAFLKNDLLREFWQSFERVLEYKMILKAQIKHKWNGV